jgi:hypothetical protein
MGVAGFNIDNVNKRLRNAALHPLKRTRPVPHFCSAWALPTAI